MNSAQLEKWRGQFGNAYIERNRIDGERLRASTGMWSRLLGRLAGAPPRSILEVGANVGANLHALRLLTDAELWAIEPNATARANLTASEALPPARILDGTAQKIGLADGAVDLAFTCGVLIHIHPDDLPAACSEIYRVARRYIICVEYFADQPEEKDYRGERGLLFKRDFGAYWMERHPDLVPLDWGFNWRRVTGLDNSTWWIFAKPSGLAARDPR